MYRWINGLASHGFIHHLLVVNREQVENAFDMSILRHTHSAKKGSDFMKHVAAMTDKAVDMVMKHSPYCTGGKLANLRAICKESMESESLTPEKIYKKDTCFEFHELLLATLVGFRMSLKALSKAKKDKEKKEKENLATEKEKIGLDGVHKAANNAWRFAILLWRIAYTPVLRCHISTIQCFICVPRGDPKDEALYNDVFDCLKPMTPAPEEHVEDVEDVDGFEAEDVPELMLRPKESNSALYVRWIQIQVEHFEALKIVTSSARRVSVIEPIDVRLLSVRPPETCITHWDQTLEQLFQTSDISNLEPHNAKSMYGFLKDTVSRMRHEIKTWKCPKVMRMFLTGESCPSNVHCEAILVSLLKYANTASLPSKDVQVAIEVCCYIL